MNTPDVTRRDLNALWQAAHAAWTQVSPHQWRIVFTWQAHRYVSIRNARYLYLKTSSGRPIAKKRRSWRSSREETTHA